MHLRSAHPREPQKSQGFLRTPIAVPTKKQTAHPGYIAYGNALRRALCLQAVNGSRLVSAPHFCLLANKKRCSHPLPAPRKRDSPLEFCETMSANCLFMFRKILRSPLKNIPRMFFLTLRFESLATFYNEIKKVALALEYYPFYLARQWEPKPNTFV